MYSDGFTTTVLPAASAGAIFHAIKQQRRIPRRDRRDDAERLAAREVEHVGLVDRDDAALDLVGEPTEVAIPLRQVAHLRRHLGQQLAVVAHLDIGERLRVLGDEIGQAEQQLSARGRRSARAKGRW